MKLRLVTPITAQELTFRLPVVTVGIIALNMVLYSLPSREEELLHPMRMDLPQPISVITMDTTKGLRWHVLMCQA